MVTRNRPLAVLMSVLLMASLTSCYGRVPVPVMEVEHSDVVGIWRSTDEGSQIVITFNGDGTSEVTGWPADVTCDNYRGLNLSRIDWDDTVSFKGAWRPAGQWISFDRKDDCFNVYTLFVSNLDDGLFATYYLISGEDEENVISFAKD